MSGKSNYEGNAGQGNVPGTEEDGKRGRRTAFNSESVTGETHTRPDSGTADGMSENAPGEEEGADSKRQWTSKSVGSRLGHWIFYMLIRIGGRLPAYALLAFVGFYYTAFSPSARKKASHYLKRRFPDAGPLGRFFQTYRLIFNLGTVLVDRAAAGILGPDTLKGSFPQEEELAEIIRSGKGFILMMSHVGCWQVAISAQGFMDTPINMLMHEAEGDIDRQYFEHSGEAKPYRVIDPGGYLGGALEMTAALKRGECLCVMGDRVMGSAGNVMAVPFLGKAALFPAGAFKIASSAGVPIVVVFSRKTGLSTYSMEIGEVIHVPSGKGRKVEKYRDHVTTYVEALEAYCVENPFQFFNFFDMWDKEGGGVRGDRLGGRN